MDQLRARADAGDSSAPWNLAELQRNRGALDDAGKAMAVLAGAGSGGAAGTLTGWMLKRGDLDGLRARVNAGHRDAAGRLAEPLARQGPGGGSGAVAPVRPEPRRVGCRSVKAVSLQINLLWPTGTGTHSSAGPAIAGTAAGPPGIRACSASRCSLRGGYASGMRAADLRRMRPLLRRD